MNKQEELQLEPSYKIVVVMVCILTLFITLGYIYYNFSGALIAIPLTMMLIASIARATEEE